MEENSDAYLNWPVDNLNRFYRFIDFNFCIKYLIKQHIMGKRRIIFILLAILVTVGLAWNNYSSRNAALQQDTLSVVNSEPVNEEPASEVPTPTA